MRFGVALLTLLCTFTTVSAQDWSVIRGEVRDGEGNALSRVEITVTPSGKTFLSDAQGFYSITGLQSGSYTLTFNMPGYASQELNIDAKTGVSTPSIVVLKSSASTSEEIMVIGSLREGQIKALNEQRHAANIKNIVAADQIGTFPDTNAAEATQRVPGVNIQRDQGEGRYVLVRGTEARLNKTSINGAALPAPEGDLRTVALDVVPLPILGSIEVTKANTPDMDGDAVGGTVNLITRTAPARETYNVGLDLGYNELAEDSLTNGQFSWGKRFADDRFGILAAISQEETNRATDNFEVEYDDGEVEDLEQRHYVITRDRIGAHLALDLIPNSNSHYVFNTSYTQFDDQEFRRRLRHRLGDDRLERELKDRFETQSILSSQFRGDIFTDNGGNLSFKVGYGYARESEPGRLDSTFRQDDVVFNPSPFNPNNIQPNPQNEDLSAYELDEIAAEENYTNDEHVAAEISYAWPVVWGDTVAQLKVGGKFRSKEKTRDNEVFVYEIDDITLPGFIDPDFNNEDLFDGRYDMGPFPGRDQVNRLLSLAGGAEKDFEEDTGDYEITEDLLAAYFMATIDFSDRFMLLPGFRFEQIDADYTSYEVAFDEEGDFLAVTPTFGDNTDDIFMPMIHTRYKLDDDSQFRAAFTSSYARARVYDQAPYRLLIREDNEIEEGNPEIDITEAWNLDLMYERYFDRTGFFTVGVFYKDLDNIIFIANRDEIFDGEEFEVTSPQNGEGATLWGAEVALQKNFTNGFGVYFNYTYTDSEADFLDRTDFILPGQTEELGNLALLFEKAGFSARLAGNLHGEYLEEVSDDPIEDLYFDQRFQLDFTASYEWNKLKFLLEITNLNDEEFVRYQGDASRPVQVEQYKRWARLGIKFEF